MKPTMKTPGRGNGTGAGDAGEASNLEANSITPGATEIAQRRASSLRLQAIGQIGGA